MTIFFGGYASAANYDTKQSLLVIDGVSIGHILSSKQTNHSRKETYVYKNTETLDVFGLLGIKLQPLVPAYFYGQEYIYISGSIIQEKEMLGDIYQKSQYIGDILSVNISLPDIGHIIRKTAYDIQSYTRTYVGMNNFAILNNSSGTFSMIGQLLVLPRREDAHIMSI